MSYLTLEVEIDHGRVIPSEPGQLPASGKGLLTILPAACGNTSVPPKRTPLEALEALQKHLHLDYQKVAAWMATVRDARRQGMTHFDTNFLIQATKAGSPAHT